MRRSGVQTEVLLSLALVMALAGLVLSAVLVARHETALGEVLGRALLAEARSPRPIGGAMVPGTEWWLVSADGRAAPRGALAGVIDAETRSLAARVAEAERPLLQPGAIWEPIRFGTPVEGGVAVGRVPRDASVRLRLVGLEVVGGVLVADVLIFTAFGAFLLRRRLVTPLQRLAAAARALGDGEGGAPVPEEGTREAAEVARSFNDMSQALTRRTDALETAVADLRQANEDLRRARASLHRAERLASVGRLAAGVAHEVGNPIGALLAFLDLAGRDPRLSEESRRHLGQAAKQGERVRVILRQLLDFSRPPRATPVPVDLAAVAEETVGLVAAQRRYAAIAFSVAREGEPPIALADPGAVGQILLNLVLNAADALAGRDSPRVELRVRATRLRRRAGDAAEADAAIRARPDGVECVVRDNGPGVEESDRERVFDPFFTTKAPGEGTGLGLANAARLAEELDGGLELLPAEPTGGAAFALRLPVAEVGERTGEARKRLRSAQRPA